jgi:hypothetical protein
MCLSIDGKYEQCASSQNMPSSITVKYELSMFIFRLIYCEVD